MEGKEEKKTKKKLIAIITIIIVIVIIAAIGGYFLYQKLELEKPIETEWGEIYYSYVKEATIEETKTNEEIGITDDMQNMQLQFCGVNQKEDPLMLLSYTKEGETYHNIYQIDNGYVSYTKIGEPSMVELLYSVEEKQYHWYLHEENDTQDTYQPLENIINANQENKLPEYTIGKGEETSVETVNGEKLSISKYDETFIKPEVEENKKVDFTTDLEEKEMKEAIEGLVTDYKSEEEIITEEVKQEVAKKETELTEQKDKMQAAEEERKQKEEEERKKAEEAARGLKVGNYTIQYGTYIGYAKSYDSTGVTKEKMTIKINEDGTLTQSGGFGGVAPTTSTYSVQYGRIIAQNGMPLRVTGNNQFTMEVAGEIDFTYQGN